MKRSQLWTPAHLSSVIHIQFLFYQDWLAGGTHLGLLSQLYNFYFEEKKLSLRTGCFKDREGLSRAGLTGMWKETSHGCNNLGGAPTWVSLGVGRFLFVWSCFRGSCVFLLPVSTWLLVGFAHPALWGSAPTCLSYVASMDTLPGWQRTGKFSPSTQKEKEETTFSFWASCSTIAQDKLPHSRPGFFWTAFQEEVKTSSLNGWVCHNQEETSPKTHL